MPGVWERVSWTEWTLDIARKNLRKAIPFTLGLLLSNYITISAAHSEVFTPETYLGEHLHVGQVYPQLRFKTPPMIRDPTLRLGSVQSRPVCRVGPECMRVATPGLGYA